MLQITPQMRILVAVEPVDGRKGIDSLVQLCREKLAADPFFRLLIYFPKPPGDLASCVGLRWPGVLVSAEATIERTFPVAPNRHAHWKPIKPSCYSRPATRILPPLPSGEE